MPAHPLHSKAYYLRATVAAQCVLHPRGPRQPLSSSRTAPHRYETAARPDRRAGPGEKDRVIGAITTRLGTVRALS